jgi:hypothetical protein
MLGLLLLFISGALSSSIAILPLTHGYYGAKAINLTNKISCFLNLIMLKLFLWPCLVSRRTQFSVACPQAHISEFVFLVCSNEMDAEDTDMTVLIGYREQS